MSPRLTDTLCTQCGLCCDGSLFADVELAGRAEAVRLEAMGLEIEEDDANGRLLVQPCAALRGTRCSVYAHRPGCCRTFECRLLKDAASGSVSVEQAITIIADTRERIGQVKTLIRALGPRGGQLPLVESCAETLARDSDGSPETERKRAELGAAMAVVQASIQKSFLGGMTGRLR